MTYQGLSIPTAPIPLPPGPNELTTDDPCPGCGEGEIGDFFVLWGATVFTQRSRAAEVQINDAPGPHYQCPNCDKADGPNGTLDIGAPNREWLREENIPTTSMNLVWEG